MNNVTIVQWTEDCQQDYMDLSVEWLDKYVRVEPADELMLCYPHQAVLNRGGMIFFARQNGRNVGTVTMIPVRSRVLELAKLAVTEPCQGQHIGDALMEAALAFARERDAKAVVLYTNRKLIPAIRLYKKYGFCEAALEHNPCEASDMKMVLEL